LWHDKGDTGDKEIQEIRRYRRQGDTGDKEIQETRRYRQGDTGDEET